MFFISRSQAWCLLLVAFAAINCGQDDSKKEKYKATQKTHESDVERLEQERDLAWLEIQQLRHALASLSNNREPYQPNNQSAQLTPVENRRSGPSVQEMTHLELGAIGKALYHARSMRQKELDLAYKDFASLTEQVTNANLRVSQIRSTAGAFEGSPRPQVLLRRLRTLPESTLPAEYRQQVFNELAHKHPSDVADYATQQLTGLRHRGNEALGTLVELEEARAQIEEVIIKLTDDIRQYDQLLQLYQELVDRWHSIKIVNLVSNKHTDF